MDTELTKPDINREKIKIIKKTIYMFIFFILPLINKATTVRLTQIITTSSTNPALGMPTNFCIAVPKTLNTIKKNIITFEYDGKKCIYQVLFENECSEIIKESAPLKAFFDSLKGLL